MDFLNANELPRRIKSYNCNTDINLEFQNLYEGVAFRSNILYNILSLFLMHAGKAT